MKNGMLSLGLAMVLGGCAGITTNAQLAPGANVSGMRTFAFFSPPGQEGKPISMGEQQVRSALERDLTQKGYSLAAPGTQPDFLVAYQAKQQQEVSVTPGYVGWYGWGGFPNVDTYTQGTLIVDFVDPKTNNTFWRGSASSVLNHPNDPNLAKIDKAVSKLLLQYPSQMAAAPRQPM
jgi:hypothetical protein